MRSEAKTAGKTSINLTIQPSHQRVKQGHKFCGTQNQDITVLVRLVLIEAIKLGHESHVTPNQE
jgi:hypothetical protein